MALPSPVRISVAYPLQPLLYIPGGARQLSPSSSSFSYHFLFRSRCSCSPSPALWGSSLLLGDCTSDALLCARLETSNGGGGASAAVLFVLLFYFPGLSVRCWAESTGVVALVMQRLDNSTSSPVFHEDISRTGGGKETDKGTRQACEMGFKPM